MANMFPLYCSYFYEDERGLFPETQYLYDLELPETFEPVNADGEVESFELIPIDKVGNLLLTIINDTEHDQHVTAYHVTAERVNSGRGL